MPESVEYTVGNRAPEHFAEAKQDMVELYPAASALIDADWVLFDFDDTLVEHDPEAQYWAALHTLVFECAEEGQFAPDEFARNYEVVKSTGNQDSLGSYLTSVRALSERHTGDPESFERAAQAFKDYPHDGDRLKDAIMELPIYPSIGPFWVARSKLLLAEGVAASFGKNIYPGMEDLLGQLKSMSKKIGVISNSRSDLVVPALKELFPGCAEEFDLVLTLGGSDIPIKPATDSFMYLQERYPDMESSNTVYVGNSQEDAAYAQGIGTQAIILGHDFEVTSEPMFVQDVAALAHVVRSHTGGAGLLRMASKGMFEMPEDNGGLVHDMTPGEMRGMVAGGLRKLWSRQIRQSFEAYSSDIWSNDYVSLRNIPNFTDMFGGVLGEINVQQPISNPALAGYFTDRRVHRVGDTYGLRGANYYACVDPRLEPAEKLAAISRELQDAVAAVEGIDRRSLTPEDLPAYLGVLDNAKQQALSLLHAVTYRERRFGISDDLGYLLLRERLLHVAKCTTRSFYEACLGCAFTTPCSSESVDSLISDISDAGIDIDPRGFKIQELDHPLHVMLSAHALASRQPVDTIVSFPSGGTQMAFAAALANEILHGLPPSSVKILSIPLSQHSGTAKEGAVPISDDLLVSSAGLFERDLAGRHVMIVDDNSSTGATIGRGRETIESFGPASLIAGVAEADPQRLLIRARSAQEDELVRNVADMRHELFDSAAGIVPVSQRDIQLRKELAGRILGVRSNWRK